MKPDTYVYWGWIYINKLERWVHIYPSTDLKWCYNGIQSRVIYEKAYTAPIAVTASLENRHYHKLIYYRDASPDLLAKLLPGVTK